MTDEGNWSGGSYNSSYVGPITVSTIPEPSIYALFGIGAIGMLMVMRRKKTA